MSDWLTSYLSGTLADHFAEQFPHLHGAGAIGDGDGSAGDGHLVPPVMVTNMHKLSAILPVSNEMLMDAGVLPDTRPRVPVTPYPWRTRLRLRIGEARTWLAERAYRLISGEDVPESEDEW